MHWNWPVTPESHLNKIDARIHMKSQEKKKEIEGERERVKATMQKQMSKIMINNNL